MTHDQNFKNLILDYPQDALRFFAPTEAAQIDESVIITPIRQEQLQEHLGDSFRELDCPLKIEWPDGRRDILLFALEEETEPRTFSIFRLIRYCLDLAELFKTRRVVPVVIFLRPGTYEQQIQLGSEFKHYLDFHYIACHLPKLSYQQYRHSDNIVARLNLPNMDHPKALRVNVYADAVQGLIKLEHTASRREKYIDFIDGYADLNDEERAEYQRNHYPQKEKTMTTMKEWFRREGREEGREEGHAKGQQVGIANMLLNQLKLKFGQPLDDAIQKRINQADTATLQQWSGNIFTARSPQEVLS